MFLIYRIIHRILKNKINFAVLSFLFLFSFWKAPIIPYLILKEIKFCLFIYLFVVLVLGRLHYPPFKYKYYSNFVFYYLFVYLHYLFWKHHIIQCIVTKQSLDRLLTRLIWTHTSGYFKIHLLTFKAYTRQRGFFCFLCFLFRIFTSECYI